MQDFEIVEKRTKPYINTYINFFLYLGVPVAILQLGILFYNPKLQSLLLIPLINLELILGILSLVWLVIIFRNGSGHTPLFLAVLGIFLIVGGILFDVTTTVINTPTLVKEGHLIVRALLENGFPLKTIYFYGIAGQTLIALNMCLLWVALLRHKKTLILLALSSNPKSYLEFLESVWSIGDLSWKQRIFMPIKVQNAKIYYHFWFLPIGFLGISTPYRWYVGLEWLNLAPVSRNAFWAIWIPVGVVLYFIWLWYEYSKRPIHKQKP